MHWSICPIYIILVNILVTVYLFNFSLVRSLCLFRSAMHCNSCWILLNEINIIIFVVRLTIVHMNYENCIDCIMALAYTITIQDDEDDDIEH